MKLTRLVVLCAIAPLCLACSADADSPGPLPDGAHIVGTFALDPGGLRDPLIEENSNTIWVGSGPAQKLFKVTVNGDDVSWTAEETGRPTAYLSRRGDILWATSHATDTLFRIDLAHDGAIIPTPAFPKEYADQMKGPLGDQIVGDDLWVAFEDGEPSAAIAWLDADTGEVRGVLSRGDDLGGHNEMRFAAGSL